MSSRRDFFKKALGGLGAAGMGMVAGCKKDGGEKPNPYAYDLSDLKKVDPKWLRYAEARRIGLDLTEPSALCSDGADHLWAAGMGRIVGLDSQGEEIVRFDVEGAPRCLALGPDGRLYVGFTAHIEVWDVSGKRLARWDDLDREAILTGLAVGDSGCFAADAGNKCVHHFGLDGSLKGEIGEKNPDLDTPGFIIPSPYFDVALGPFGELWAANTGRHWVEQYTVDGRRISSWGKASYGVQGFSGCCNPTHLAVTPDGRFITSEKGLPRVKIHQPNGELEAVIAGPLDFQDNTTGLDLAILNQGRVAVLVPNEGQVRIYRPEESEN